MEKHFYDGVELNECSATIFSEDRGKGLCHSYEAKNVYLHFKIQ